MLSVTKLECRMCPIMNLVDALKILLHLSHMSAKKIGSYDRSSNAIYWGFIFHYYVSTWGDLQIFILLQFATFKWNLQE